MAATIIYRPIELLLAGVSDSNGVAVASGKVRFYSPNTVVTQTVYQDEQGVTAWPQPIELNANGQAVVYAKENVRMVVKDSTEATTYVDNTITAIRFEQVIGEVTGFFGGDQSSLQQFFQAANTSFGKGFQYLASATSAFAVARNYSAVLKERAISVKDFGATGNGTTDDAPSVRAAIAELKLVPGGVLWFPQGIYKLNDELLFDFDGWSMMGPGGEAAVLRTGVTNKNIVRVASVTNGYISGLGFDNLTAVSTSPAIQVEGLGNGFVVERNSGLCSPAGFVFGTTGGVSAVRVTGNDVFCDTAGRHTKFTNVSEFIVDNNRFLGGMSCEILGTSSGGIVHHNFFEGADGIKVDAACTGTAFIFGPNVVSTCTTPLDIAATGDIRAIVLGQADNNGGTGDASSYSVAAATSISHNGRDTLRLTAGAPTTIDRMQNSYTGHTVALINISASNISITNLAGAPVANFRQFNVSVAPLVLTPNDTLYVTFSNGVWTQVSTAVLIP